MRYKNLFLPLLVLIPLCGCSRMEYETAGKLNKEITLFQDGISLPLGNVGPVTVESILNGSPLRDVLTQFATIGADGVLSIESEEELLNRSAYEIALKIPDKTQPYHWEVGDLYSSSIGSMAMMMAMFGFQFPHQSLTVQAVNPIYGTITLNTTARISCTASDYTESFKKEEVFADYSISSTYGAKSLVQFDVPENISDRISTVVLENVTLDLPENLPDKIPSGVNSFFKFSYKYKTQVAAGPNFSLSPAIPVDNLKLEIGKYKLHQCKVSFDLVNSLPLDVTIDEVKVLDKRGEVNPDIIVSSGVKIAGGTIESPATTPVTLEVKSANGTIPDISGIELSLTVKTSDGLSNVPLSTRMSLSVKSASVTLSGGITLFGHEEE